MARYSYIMAATRKSKLLNIEFYLSAAETHGGDSEPEHEVGDLQGFLRAIWKLTSQEQRRAFATSPDVQMILAGALVDYEEELRNIRAD